MGTAERMKLRERWGWLFVGFKNHSNQRCILLFVYRAEKTKMIYYNFFQHLLLFALIHDLFNHITAFISDITVTVQIPLKQGCSSFPLTPLWLCTQHLHFKAMLLCYTRSFLSHNALYRQQEAAVDWPADRQRWISTLSSCVLTNRGGASTVQITPQPKKPTDFPFSPMSPLIHCF